MAAKSGNMQGAAVVLGTIAGIAIVARWAKGRSAPKTTTKGAPVPGPKEAPRPMQTPKPITSTEPAAQRAATIAPRLTAMWTEGTGLAASPSPAALEIILAKAWLESGIGGWWKGEMTGSNNLGSRQCDKSEQGGAAKEPWYRCAQSQDSKPTDDGQQVTFSVKFRFYLDHNGRTAVDWGALDFLRSLRQFGGDKALAAAQAGDVPGYCLALYKGHYFGGFNATEAELAKGGGAAADAAVQAFRAYVAQGIEPKDAGRIAGYVKALWSHLPKVSGALGHTEIAARFAAAPAVSGAPC